MMKSSGMHAPTVRVTVLNNIIVSKANVAANCETHQCKSCNMSRARQFKAKVTKSKVIESLVGAISCDKRATGEFVLTDQYIVEET